jgi:nucleoside-specific outer membrane channel protein Tsx
MTKLAAALILLLPISAFAEIKFQDFSLTYVRGNDYEVGDEQRQIGTFEYVNVSTWGDAFLFIDWSKSANGDTNTYAELSPRFTLLDIEEPHLISRLSLATQIEFAEDFTNYLYGLGVNLRLPGFSNFKLSAMRRSNEERDNNYQLTTVWALPFTLGKTRWLFDGFSDWASAKDNRHTSLSIISQLKLNISALLNRQLPFYVGIEYVYWHNKFGIDGVTENNLNLLIKVHF